MFRRSHACLVALLLLLFLPAGADESGELASLLASARQLVQEGKLVQARRMVSQAREAYSDREELRELLAQIDALLARETGSRTPAVAAPESGTAFPAPVASEGIPIAGRAYKLVDPELILLWVEPGSFLMATTHGNDDATDVTLTRGYWLGRTEVTQEQWRALRPDNQSPSSNKGSSRPVENVSWVETMEFIRVLNARERTAGRLPAGYEYTLPTEAEWEYACRAGSTGPYAGNLAEMGWHATNSGGRTHAVAALAPNAWGFHDMHGNVLEWCLDGPAPYPGRPVSDPIQGFVGSAAPAVRVLRGGAWNSSAGLCRADQRYSRSISLTSAAVGFRLALAPVRPSSAAPQALQTTP